MRETRHNRTTWDWDGKHAGMGEGVLEHILMKMQGAPRCGHSEDADQEGKIAGLNIDPILSFG